MGYFMRKIICTVLAIVIMISLCACEENYTHGEYEITIDSICDENNKVGNEWSKYYSCNGRNIKSGDIITAPLGAEATIYVRFTENDKYSDTGYGWIDISLIDGASTSFIVKVVEDNGSYDGNIAIWKVTVKVKLVRKKQVKD